MYYLRNNLAQRKNSSFSHCLTEIRKVKYHFRVSHEAGGVRGEKVHYEMLDSYETLTLNHRENRI